MPPTQGGGDGAGSLGGWRGSPDSSWPSSSPTLSPSAQPPAWVLKGGVSLRDQVQARGSCQASFLLGTPAWSWGHCRGLESVRTLQRVTPAPVSLCFTQRDWFCSYGMDDGWPHSEPAARRIFQRSPVLPDSLGHFLRNFVMAISSCGVQTTSPSLPSPALGAIWPGHCNILNLPAWLPNLPSSQAYSGPHHLSTATSG